MRYNLLFITALFISSSMHAGTSTEAKAQSDQTVAQEYQNLVTELQAVESTWKDAPKADRDEAIKAWRDTNGAKLAELRRKLPPAGQWELPNPYDIPLPSTTPPARRAYIEAKRQLWELEHPNNGQGSEADTNAKAAIEKQRVKVTKLEEAAQIERDNLEKQRLESEKKKREQGLLAVEADKAARREFLNSLKELKPEERQAALKKWNDEHKTGRTSSTEALQ